MSVYRSIAFPFQLGDQSFPNNATDVDVVKQSIMQILLTTRGERVNRPDFGCDVINLVFENNDDILAELIRLEVSTAISRYEPRAIIHDVVVDRQDSTLRLDLLFSVAGLNQQQQIQVQYSI